MTLEKYITHRNRELMNRYKHLAKRRARLEKLAERELSRTFVTPEGKLVSQ